MSGVTNGKQILSSLVLLSGLGRGLPSTWTPFAFMPTHSFSPGLSSPFPLPHKAPERQGRGYNEEILGTRAMDFPYIMSPHSLLCLVREPWTSLISCPLTASCVRSIKEWLLKKLMCGGASF